MFWTMTKEAAVVPLHNALFPCYGYGARFDGSGYASPRPIRVVRDRIATFDLLIGELMRVRRLRAGARAGLRAPRGC